MSLENFKEGLKDYFLELGWKQWTKLGISGRERADDWVNTDPEALVLLTGFLGSKDLRLTDNVISWLATNESLIHKSRLKTILDIGHVPTLLRLSEVFQAAGKGDERSSWNTFKDYCSDKIKAWKIGGKEIRNHLLLKWSPGTIKPLKPILIITG